MKRPEGARAGRHLFVATLAAALAGCSAFSAQVSHDDPAITREVERFGAALAACSQPSTYAKRAGAMLVFENALAFSKTYSLYEVNAESAVNAAIAGLGSCAPADLKTPIHAVDDAVSAMMASFDSEGSYLLPGETGELTGRTLRGRAGIGVELIARDGAVLVVAALLDSPASRAGLAPRDRIVAIDGRSVDSLPVEDVIDRLVGDLGSHVEVTVQKHGSPASVTLRMKRETVYARNLDVRILPDGYVVIHLQRLGAGAGGEMNGALEELRDQGLLRGLVLDLRFNAGGLLTQGIHVSNLFLESGLIARTETREPSGGTTYTATNGKWTDFPMIVLVNEGTASGGELIAAALAQNGRARLVGKRTFGRGSIQSYFELNLNRGLKLTTSRLRTPNGALLSDGLMPDVATETGKDLFDRSSPSDPAIAQALAMLRDQEPRATAGLR